MTNEHPLVGTKVIELQSGLAWTDHPHSAWSTYDSEPLARFHSDLAAYLDNLEKLNDADK